VAECYTAQYFDHNGKRRKAATGCPDKATAEQVADRIQSEVALRKRGIVNAEQEQVADTSRRTVAQHLADFEAGMVAAGRTSDHVTRTVGFIREIADAAGFVNLADITADGVNRFASDLTTKGRAARTVQARLTAIKGFTRWLATHGKLPRDPLASVKKPNPAADRRHERRMLRPEEWNWLRVTTEQAPERYGMTGHERMLLYAVAIQSGLRSGECRSLTRGRLLLDDDQPYIVCKARSTKNKKDARQYIQPGLAGELAQHIGTKAFAAPVFTMPDETNVARMFRADLADARRAWLGSTQDPAERLRREQSDFLQAANHDGEKADFHSLRHTTGAWLALAGVHPKVVQTVMRHSSITLTMDTYGHLFPGQDAQAVASLPDIMGGGIGQEAMTATGTDGQAADGSWGQMRGQYSLKSSQDVAGSCEPDKDSPNESGQPNVLTFNALGSKQRKSAKRCGSRPGGI
jgi:integrase